MTSKDKTIHHNESNVIQDLASLLQKDFGNEVTVIDHTASNLLPSGENYASTILKVTVKIRRTSDSPIENLHLVAKKFVENEFLVRISWSMLMKKEVFMYTHIIPFYEKLELECGMRESETIAKSLPKIYGHRLSLDTRATEADKDAVLLMENLTARGYYMEDKKIGLDLQHSKAAIKLLARFHALGIAARTKYPSDFESIKIESLKDSFDHQIFMTMTTGFINHIKKDPRLSHYVDRIEKIADRLKDGFAYEHRRHELWSTIVHHDFWTNNIMFHSDEAGEIDDVMFVDFQTYSFIEVFADLSLFLCASLNDVTKVKHFDELLGIYYETFVSVLEKLKVDVKVYSRQKFDERFKEVAGYAFVRCALALNFFMVEVDDKHDQGVITALSLANCKKSDLYYEKLMQLIQIYDERDWFH